MAPRAPRADRRGTPSALPLLALLVIGLASCRTERLLRTAPRWSGAGERVNLWPLAYRDEQTFSVLWPLFDVDRQGFALRPLIERDGDELSLLYPLSSLDTSSGHGWFLNAYRLDENAGLFPVANFGSLSWIGPIWWSERSSGLLPLVCFGNLSWIGPLWWKEGAGGLFPLVNFGATSWIGPVFWSGGTTGLFPILGFGTTSWVGPVWWRTTDREPAYGLFPLVSVAEGGRDLAVLPFYSHDLDEQSSVRNVLLGLGHSARSPEGSERWLLPLYWQRERPEGGDTLLLPFFWKRTRGDEASVYTLLGNRTVDADGTGFNLYPLWWSNRGKDSSWRMLLPLFYWAQEGDERTLITPLGGRGWSSSGEDAFVNVLGPLYHHSRSTRRDEERTAFLWPLFESRREGDERSVRMLGLYSSTSSPGTSEYSWAFGLGHARHTSEGDSHRLWPLYSWSDEGRAPGPMYALTLYGRREREGSSRSWLFPLYAGRSTPTSSSHDGLLGLLHHERQRIAQDDRLRWWVWPLVSHAENAGGPGFPEVTSLASWSRWDGGRHFQLGASMLYSATHAEDEQGERSTSRSLLFLTHAEERTAAPAVPASSRIEGGSRLERDSYGFLFDAFVSEHETYRVWNEGVLEESDARALAEAAHPRPGHEDPSRSSARSVLARHGLAPASDDQPSLRSAIEAFAAENTHTLERRHVRVPLVLGYERVGEEKLAWSGPLWLARYEREGRDSFFSLLFYGYRRAEKDGWIRRDIFPFITWDSGPESSTVSFLWRLFRYEREGERRGGYVLFIPWGDA